MTDPDQILCPCLLAEVIGGIMTNGAIHAAGRITDLAFL